MNRNVILMNVGAALMWMSMYACVPTLPAFASSLGATAAMIGVLGGAYGVMQVLLRIPLGFLSDKVGRDKLMIIIGFVVLTWSGFLCVSAQSVEAIILARGVAGAAAAWWVIISASYAKYNDESRQVKAQGVLNAFSSLGKLLAALVGGIVAQMYGLRAPFVVALAVAVAGLVTMCFLKSPDRKTPREAPPTARELLVLAKNRELLAISCFGIFSQLISFAIPTYFTFEAARALGADAAQLGGLTLVYFLVTTGASLFVGTKLYRRIGGMKCVAVTFALAAFTCIPYFYHTSLGVIYLMQALSGVGYGVVMSVLSGYVIKCVQPAQRGAAMGIFQSLYAVGIFVGPVIAGAVIEYVSFDAAYWVVGAITAAAAVLSVFLLPRRYDRS